MDGSVAVYAANSNPYNIEQYQYNFVDYETVKTPGIKIEIQSRPEFSGGIYEVKLK